jgi:hypothetical protein
MQPPYELDADGTIFSIAVMYQTENLNFLKEYLTCN